MVAFEIVVVCTGNRARSPIAEAFLRQQTAHLPVRVSSRGTLDLGAVAALPEAVEAAGELGIDLSGHHARTLEGSDLSSADLVLGFERMHVMTAVVSAQALLERTFTLPELVQLLERPDEAPAVADPIERARWAIRTAQSRRPTDLSQIGEPEIADPLGQPIAEFRATAVRLRDLTLRLAIGLFGRAQFGGRT